MDNRLSPWSTFWAAVNIPPTFKILSQLKNLLLQIMSSTHCAIWPCEVSSVSAPWSSLDNACRETFGFENEFDHSKIVGSVHSTMYIEWNQTKVLLRLHRFRSDCFAKIYVMGLSWRGAFEVGSIVGAKQWFILSSKSRLAHRQLWNKNCSKKFWGKKKTKNNNLERKPNITNL